MYSIKIVGSQPARKITGAFEVASSGPESTTTDDEQQPALPKPPPPSDQKKDDDVEPPVPPELQSQSEGEMGNGTEGTILL